MYGSCNVGTQILYKLETKPAKYKTIESTMQSQSSILGYHRIPYALCVMQCLSLTAIPIQPMYITCARFASTASVWCIMEMDFMQNWLPDRQIDTQVCTVQCTMCSCTRAHIDLTALYNLNIEAIIRSTCIWEIFIGQIQILFECLNVDRVVCILFVASVNIIVCGRTF